jgi:hypothetical protein
MTKLCIASRMNIQTTMGYVYSLKAKPVYQKRSHICNSTAHKNQPKEV